MKVPPSRFLGFLPLILLLLASTLFPAIAVRAQNAAATPLSCAPLRTATTATPAPASTPQTAPPAAELISVKVGFVPISIYAPVFVAKEKGYFAEQGVDVTLESFPGGSDLVALTASGELQATATGAGPAFWNASALGLPIKIVAPGHTEGSPVATPLMISRAVCEAGTIRSVADLAGKRVSVNARGATEYWLDRALSTGGLTIDDVQLETLPFPDAVVALEAGAIDAAMVGEPLATKAERDGIAVRLADDFPVQDVLPTLFVANSDFAAENPAVVQGLVTAYLKAARELAGDGHLAPENLAIIEAYTNVPPDLVAAAVPPIYPADGTIDPAALDALQRFFRSRGQLEYDADLDPETLIDRSFLDAALASLGSAAP